MAKRKDTRLVKRATPLKSKERPKKGQKLKDETSILELNKKTDIYEIHSQSKQTRPEKVKENNKILKELEDLAHKSVLQKKDRIKEGTNTSQLVGLLSGISSINVSQEQEKASPNEIPKPVVPDKSEQGNELLDIDV